MDAKTHIVAGALVGAGTYWIGTRYHNEQANFWEAVACAASGAAMAVLPDILEPANSPSHRSHFHSVAAGASLAYVSTRIWYMSRLPTSERVLYLGCCLAYTSHLLLDLRTPAGLPLL